MIGTLAEQMGEMQAEMGEMQTEIRGLQVENRRILAYLFNESQEDQEEDL